MDKNKKRKNKYYLWFVFSLIFVLWMALGTDIIVKLSRTPSVEKCSFVDFQDKDDVVFFIDDITETGNMLETVCIRGWSFTETDTDNTNREIKLVLKNEKKCYVVTIMADSLTARLDVIAAFPDQKFGINNAIGFIYEFSTLQMKNGIYNIYIYVWENEENYGIVDTGIQVKKDGASFKIYMPEEHNKRNILVRGLNYIMNKCYALANNYGLAIILFTLISKIVLLPVSLWTYFNSIKMIKIQPDVNIIKATYYGQKDVIAEQESKLYKKEGYHPLLSTVPLIIQLVLLMGVVEVIKNGIANPAIDMSMGFVNLGQVPASNGIRLIWSPVIAGLSSWILCICQNAANVLQSEQSKYNKYGTMIFSVGLSLYLGWFVAIGTALYWVCSNLMAVAQLYILNGIIKPRRYVDYEKLNKSREELAALQGIGKKKWDKEFFQNKKREREDYKRFFSVVNKHLVFYSESNGFYKYFKDFIEYLLEHTNITIHYITSDPKDNIFNLAYENHQIRGYYIGENKLITLMMKMDADVVVMTMPDLENFHIKRSYIRKDIEYVFVQHGIGSNNMGMRKGCMDYFDTIFCAGPHQVEEIVETEKIYELHVKKTVKVGYPLIDNMRTDYDKVKHEQHEKKKILIAPSWQKDNIIDSCLEQILDELKDKGYDIIVRPHPQEVRLKKEYMDVLKEKYESNNIEIQTDFSSNNPILEADLLITDWSGISWEYAFTTRHPILFINTPMKVMNPDYKEIPTVPLNILLRDKLGKNLDLNELDKVFETADYLLNNMESYKKEIENLAEEYLYNLGTSAEAGAKYLIETIKEKIARKGKKND